MRKLQVGLAVLSLCAFAPVAASAGSLSVGGTVGGAVGGTTGGLSAGAGLGGDKSSGLSANTSVGVTSDAGSQTVTGSATTTGTATSADATIVAQVNAAGRITNLKSAGLSGLTAYFEQQGYTALSPFAKTTNSTLEATAQLSGTPVTIDVDTHGNISVE